MNRTNRIKLTRTILTMLSILLARSLAGSSCTTEPQRPNIIFIMGDDMRWNDFGFARGLALTPHLDMMAREGFLFSRTYIPAAACTPTRFSSLTGRFASRCQAPSFLNSVTREQVYSVVWNTDLSYEPDILSRVLQEEGYVTGIVGKWHNGSSEEYMKIRRSIARDGDPTDPAVAARVRELDQSMQEHLHGLGFDYAREIVYGNYPDHPLKALHFHNPEVITKAAVDFIEHNRDRNFFLYMPTTLLHGPPPWLSLHADPRISYGGWLEEPVDIQPSRENVIARGREAGIPENIIPATWLDDGIGVVLETLERLGLKENTMVVFMNDQGHDGGKGSCYEGGIRVPSMIYWPGTVEPGQSDAITANLDLYPTILEACGIPYQKENHDGTSLWPLMQGKKEMVRDHLYCEWSYTRAIVTPEWKYLSFRVPPSMELDSAERVEIANRVAGSTRAKNYDPRPFGPLSHTGMPGGSPIERYQGIAHYPHYFDADQLYHLKSDSLEQVNLASDPAHEDQLKEMKELLGRWVRKMPGTFGEF